MANVKLTREEENLFFDMIWFYRRYPIYAARDILGIRLSIHQGLMLKSIWHQDYSSCILFCGRGASKTFMLALYALLSAILYSNEQVVIVGSGFRQSKEVIIQGCEKMINCELSSQEEVWFAKQSIKERTSKSVVIKAPDAYRIEFKNGSHIIAVPLSKEGDQEEGGGGNNVRGYRATKLLIDETKDVPRHVISKILEPMSIVKSDPVGEVDSGENKTVYAGTIDFESSHFWELIQNHEDSVCDTNHSFHDINNIIRLDYEDTFWTDKNGNKRNWSIPYRMDIKKIERSRDSGESAEEDWLAEYKCIPIRNTGKYYTHELIDNATNFMLSSDPERDGLDDQFLVPKLFDEHTPVGIGVDVGRIDDFFSIVVVSLNQLDTRSWDPKAQTGNADFNYVIYAFQQRNMTYKAQSHKLREVMRRFPNYLKIAIDARGGEALLDELAFHYTEDDVAVCDPDDDNRWPDVKNKDEAITCVVSVKATDTLNNEWNSFCRGQLEQSKFFFPKPMSRHRSAELEEVHHNIDRLTKQFVKVKTRVSPQTSLFKFFMENPKKSKKDLYSATIYIVGAVKGILQQEETEDEPEALGAWV